MTSQLYSVKESWLTKFCFLQNLHAKLVQPKLSLFLHHVLCLLSASLPQCHWRNQFLLLFVGNNFDSLGTCTVIKVKYAEITDLRVIKIHFRKKTEYISISFHRILTNRNKNNSHKLRAFETISHKIYKKLRNVCKS